MNAVGCRAMKDEDDELTLKPITTRVLDIADVLQAYRDHREETMARNEAAWDSIDRWRDKWEG